MASEAKVRQALTAVIYIPLNAGKGEGKAVSERYHVGPYFPVFILTDSTGNVINRWTGYTGAGRFLRSFNGALSNLTTIDDRIAAFFHLQSRDEALFLARYHAGISEFVKAAKYYRRAQTLQGDIADFSYQIFENYANAAWNDQIGFDEVLPAADSVIAAPDWFNPADNIAKVAQLLSKLARRREATDRIGPYLKAGISASSERRDDKGRKLNADLKADFALHAEHDTLGAIAIKKAALGENWTTDLNTYYPFGSWCYERRINLVEAQRYVQHACKRASDGPFKAKHLSLLANICEARGFIDEAVRHAEQAVEQDPEKESYTEQLDRLRGISR